MVDNPKQLPSDPPSPVQGVSLTWTTDDQRLEAVNEAFDYRGDVTIHTVDGRQIQGYIFDRQTQADKPFIRVIPSDGPERVTLAYDDIARLEFTGRDTAAGKSWETWVKKYHEKKVRGESTDLHPDPLDE